MEIPAETPPCIVHEDEHILVVNKPAGMNTHAPSPFAGEGAHEWLRNREPRWANLAIIHRLDKTTSGLIVFAKTKMANRSLGAQFAERKVRKEYLLLTSRQPAEPRFSVSGGLSRAGEKYFIRPDGEFAETHFRSVESQRGFHLVAAAPVTGRTHQIRVHAQARGIPILGDSLYGGAPFSRVCLHAAQLRFQHPETGRDLSFRVEPDFFSTPARALRKLLIEPTLTTAHRILHGETQEELHVDRWGEYLLAQSERIPSESDLKLMRDLAKEFGSAGIYCKALNKQVGRASIAEAAPKWLEGSRAPEPFTVVENGVVYEISFQQGYSVGLFLDQRENRRRILKNYVAPDFEVFRAGASREVLNTFAYTCGFSVCAALAGARTTSLDLSKKYLDWGQKNFALNKINSAQHDFIFGDVFDWAPRLAKKGRAFDLILLDPPTFSRTKSGGTFQAEKDFGKLVATILPLLRRGGVLFASTNSQRLSSELFLSQITHAIAKSGRRVTRQHYVPQPFDFPISKNEPAYLKTVWLRVD